MYLKIFSELPADAIRIRTAVFCGEQGFKNEFDETDKISVHLVLYDDGLPVATCRVFKDGDLYFIGRVAVIKVYRGKGAGTEIMQYAEKHIISEGGKTIAVSSQKQAEEFYKKQGFTAVGGEYDDEGCPHVRMIKNL
ncbi:MAG: GNAT family N-acetyltransferase [Clostridia bacterium]|nr:GNAT family N-acetyltransferase [Clostridia bacterium]